MVHGNSHRIQCIRNRHLIQLISFTVIMNSSLAWKNISQVIYFMFIKICYYSNAAEFSLVLTIQRYRLSRIY